MTWWKLLSIILLLYMLIVGMLVPLKPGIIDVSPLTIEHNAEQTITIQGYNSNYQSADDLSIWLKLDSISGYKAKQVSIESETSLKATFDIGYIQDKSADATILIDNNLDDTSISPDALTILGNETASNLPAKLEAIPYASLGQKEGFLFPIRTILHETVRNTFFHVAIWMAMFILLTVGLIYSIFYLKDNKIGYDIKAASFTNVALLYGILGIVTGSVWAKYTWGTFWTADIKLNMVAISMLVYFAYWILRASIDDVDKRARLAAIYNIFAFVAMIPLIFVIPRMSETISLHPGNGGNPALGGEDLDNTLRMVFYPAIIGYALLGTWIASLQIRLENLRLKRLRL